MAAQDTPALVSLNYILASVKAYLQVDDKQDEFLMQLIIDIATDISTFHADISGNKPVKIPIINNTAALPSDFIDYVVVGRVVGNSVVSLTYNPRLAIPNEESCGLEVLEYPSHVQVAPSFHYGAKGGINIATYKLDKRNRRIILSSDIPSSELYLEYVSSGINENTLIPRYAVPTIRAYVIWMRVENDPRVPYNEKERKSHLFVTEMRRLKEFETRLTAEEIMDALYSGYTPCIKR